ncbi:hypothetical protein [Swaminathania salitolerans]|uniref:Uncharacterized protein n=1 Tax=Swaminathania salitolerans TaxID=182838 RepID=A0A511BKM8_9PROT|nr:hypothetical protein [Swaminathania salitolerans]GBQ09638.1 hypothetical protein AA21291_0146 [Swaminathania salitolerans LMG 21291]GEL00897.1 hypothetical protein SSA02_00600 [Swaminathania salitolerans]
MKYLILFALISMMWFSTATCRAGEFRFDTDMPIATLDKVVALLNRKAPLYENAMETITSASRDGRTLVETIDLSREADDAIQTFSRDKLKQLLYDATTNRYCNTDMKIFMDGNVSIRLIFFLHGKEFYRILQIPFSCTIVN